MLAGFIRIEAAQVVFWMRRIHFGSRLQRLPLPDRQEAAARQRSQQPLLHVVEGQPQAASTSGTVSDGTDRRPRVIVAGQGDSECLTGLVKVGIGELRGRELTDLLLKLPDDLGRFLVSRSPMRRDRNGVPQPQSVPPARIARPRPRPRRPDRPTTPSATGPSPRGRSRRARRKSPPAGRREPDDRRTPRNHAWVSDIVVCQRSTPFCNCY